MTERIYNFSAGPATLPVDVLRKAQSELLSLNGIGMSVMEISHRSKHFDAIIERAKEGIRQHLGIPDNYQILFLQGGATLQFSMIPLNFLGEDETADYIVTGAWGQKAIKEAQREGNAVAIYNSEETGFKSVPTDAELTFSENAKYIHYTSNETIEGVEFKRDLDGGGIPVICDMSSNILSKSIDIEKYALIYAGAQKISVRAVSHWLLSAMICSKKFPKVNTLCLITGRSLKRIRCSTHRTPGEFISLISFVNG
jgi:phosphoserine aminotransferase